MSQRTKSTPLHRLFVRQQPKVNASVRKAQLLKVYADNNHQAIAELINQWLQED